MSDRETRIQLDGAPVGGDRLVEPADAAGEDPRHLGDAGIGLAVHHLGLGDEVEGGFELCRELRALAPRLPIIFLTARDTDLDIISGLRLGADDYLSKQTSLPHLLARIAALLRRVEAQRAPADASAVMQEVFVDLEIADAARAKGRSPAGRTLEMR